MSIDVAMDPFGTEFWKFSRVRLKKAKKSIFFNVLRFQASITPQWLQIDGNSLPNEPLRHVLSSFHFYSAPQCSHCKRCTSYSISVCLSVCLSVRLSVCTRRYCVKTTARSTVQCALSDSKMCLVLQKPKNIPLPPEILAQTDLPPPDSSESWHVLPCSASTVRASEKSSIMANRKSYTGFLTSRQPRFYAALTSSK